MAEKEKPAEVEKEKEKPAEAEKEKPTEKEKPAEKKCDTLQGICPLATIAKPMQKPATMRDEFKVNLNEKIHNFGEKAIKALNNPKECIINYKKSAPNVFDTMGNSLTKSAESIWKVTNLGIAEAIEQLNNTAVLENVAMGKGYYVATAVLQKKIQDKVNEILLGEKAEEIMAANPNPELLIAKVMARHAIWKQTFEMAEFQGILKPWINDYVNMLRQTLDLAQDPLHKFKGEIDQTIKNLGGNLGEVLSKTVTNLIVTAIAAIPGVGPIGTLIKTIDETAKKSLDTCEEPLVKGGQIITATVQTLDKQQQILQCKVKEIAEKAKPLIAKAEAAAAAASKVTSKVTSAPALPASKAGGGGGTLKQKINHTTKRVNALLQRFAARKKINYTRRLQKRRPFF